MLVGITGYAQHGKDTVAKRLVSTHGYTRMGFADALKDLALTLDPVVDMHGNTLRMLVELEGWEGAKRYAETRRILQVLGTEGARGTFGDDCWIRALDKRWTESGIDQLVIPDVRFPNEAEWVYRNGGVMLRVVRLLSEVCDECDEHPVDAHFYDGGADRRHESERYVLGLPVDAVIWNVGTVDDMNPTIDSIVSDIEEGFLPRWSTWSTTTS